jgi:hypothetical protein
MINSSSSRVVTTVTYPDSSTRQSHKHGVHSTWVRDKDKQLERERERERENKLNISVLKRQSCRASGCDYRYDL